MSEGPATLEWKEKVRRLAERLGKERPGFDREQDEWLAELLLNDIGDANA